MNADGLVTDEQVDYAVEHAQRVAEGVNHEIHRNTWRYSVVIEQQRKALAERRERLLTTDVAAMMLLRPDRPRRPRRSTRTCSPERPASIALYHLDRLWAEHLAELSEVREGVHLRALGRLDPLDEFHRAAVPAFNDLVPEIEARTIATFEETEFDDGLAAGRRAAGPAERHLDVPGARQPVRLRAGPADRVGRAAAQRRLALTYGHRAPARASARGRGPDLRRFDPGFRG